MVPSLWDETSLRPDSFARAPGRLHSHGEPTLYLTKPEALASGLSRKLLQALLIPDRQKEKTDGSTVLR